MYTAKLNDQVIELQNLTKEQLLTLKHQKATFHCVDCEADVRLKVGEIKQAHFAHVTPCQKLISLESEAHQRAKALLYEWAKTLNPTWIQLEYSFSHIKRIADLAFEIEEQIYVIEIQKSLISNQVFNMRSNAYASAGIKVIWVFLTPVHQSRLTTYIPPLMQRQKHLPILYLDNENQELTIYNGYFWLSQSECVCSTQKLSLQDLTLSLLCDTQLESSEISKQKWLEIKKAFRLSKWYYYQRKNWALRKLCATHRISLSLIGAEVGWPTLQCGGFLEPLFVWQSIVSLCLQRYGVGECVTAGDLLYRVRYYLTASKRQPKDALYQELRSYLAQLVAFDLIEDRGGYYVIKRRFTSFERVEAALLADASYGEKVTCLNLKKPIKT